MSTTGKYGAGYMSLGVDSYTHGSNAKCYGMPKWLMDRASDENWDTLYDSKTDGEHPNSSERKIYEFKNEKWYRFYRLKIMVVVIVAL